MRIAWLLVVLLATLSLAAPCLARPSASGSIRGRVRVRSGGPAAGMTFLLDGSSVRPRLRKGAFTIPSVPAGGHTLSVIDAGGRGVHRLVAVRARAVANVGSLTLEAGGQITGIVSRANADTGLPEPLVGVEVRAEPEEFLEEGGVAPPSAAPLAAVTDESGAYQFRAVSSGSYRVSVVAPGLEAGVEFVWVDVGRTSVADFLLQEAIEEGVGTVSGTVLDQDGQSLEGALVMISTLDYFPVEVSRQSRIRAASKGKLHLASPSSLPRGSFMTLTDHLGRYSLNVPSGRLWVDVWADGYLPQSGPLTLHPRDSVTVDFTLQSHGEGEAASLSGRVTDGVTGQALAGASVTVSSAFIAGGIPISHFSTISDEHGAYVIAGIPAGVWVVEAYLEGHGTARAEIEIGDEPITLDLVLYQAHTARKQR